MDAVSSKLVAIKFWKKMTSNLNNSCDVREKKKENQF